jgi:transposase
VRKWLRRAQVDAGERPGTTTEEKAEIKALKRELAELRRANVL